MAMINKTHTIGEFSIRFFCKKSSWCQIYISKEPPYSEQYLGGESIEIVKDRLARKINNLRNLTNKTRINNQNVYWLISLMDGHTTFFISQYKPISLFVIFEDRGLENPIEIPVTSDDLKAFSNFVANL